MTDAARRSRDGKPTQGRPPESRAPVLGDDLPQILEVFGSAPLVSEPSGAVEEDEADDMNSWKDGQEPLADGPGDWEDPMASVADDDVVDPVESLDPMDAVDTDDDSDRPREASAEDVDAVKDMVRLSEQRLGRLELTLQSMAKQVNFLPPKLRGLGKKVDELTTSVGDVRVRNLLIELVGLGDLVEGARRALPDDDSAVAAGAQRFFKALSTRIDQILEAHDATEIDTDVDFDPTVHNAIEVTEVDDPDLQGRILEVVRPGYRTEHSVLRYAEVTMGRYKAADGEAEAAAGEGDEDAATRHGVRLMPFLGANGSAEHERNTSRRSDRRHDKSKHSNDEKDLD